MMSPKLPRIALCLLFSCGGPDVLIDAGLKPDAGPSEAGVIDDAGPPYERCPENGLSLEGTLEDTPLQYRGNSRFQSEAPGRIQLELSQRGYAYIATSTIFNGPIPDPVGLLLMPENAPFAGEAYCAGPGSWIQPSLLSDESTEVKLRGLKRLLSCAEAPSTNDRLTVCFGAPGSQCPGVEGEEPAVAISGSLVSRPIERSGRLGLQWSESPEGELQVRFADGRGIASLSKEGDHHAGWLLWLGEAPLEPPIAYCVERALVDQDDSDGLVRFDFASLKLRGSCTWAEALLGELDLCF